MSNEPILITGAGIGGFSTALALARAGQPSIILERSPVLSEVGAGLQLAPNATRRLRTWGALKACEAKAFAPQAIDIRRWTDGALLVCAPVGCAQTRWGAPYLVTHRADLLAALAETAAQSPLIQLCLDAELIGWKDAEDGILVRVKGGSEIHGKALIGADGVRSRVRAGLLLKDGDDAPIYTGRTAWRTTIPFADCPERLDHSNGALWLGRRAHLTYYPLVHNQTLNVVAIIQDEWREPDMEDFWSSAGDAAFLKIRFANWATEIRQIIASAPQWIKWPLFERAPLARWSSGNVTLLGDAAHAMPPFLAQGAAQAIEDADALGEAFSLFPNNARAAFVHYEKARILRANRIQAASRRQGFVYHLNGPAAMARNIAMRAIGPKGMLRALDWLYKI